MQIPRIYGHLQAWLAGSSMDYLARNFDAAPLIDVRYGSGSPSYRAIGSYVSG